MPGEWYSPTQPFPTKPPAYDRQGVSMDDLIDFTPELRAEAAKMVERYKIGPIFTPPVVSKLPGPLATLTSGFATNWPGGSYDPETHIAYIYSQSGASPLGLVASPADLSDMNFIQGSALSGARRTGGSGSAAGGGRTGEDAPAAAAPAAPAGGEGGGGLTVRGLPLLKPPYAPYQRDRSEQGRHPLADRARRDRGQRPQQPVAERADHSANRPPGI